VNKRKEKGFTLIELLVVVAIIAILALIVLLALNPVEMQRRTRDSRRLSDLGTLRRAIDLALADGDKGSLPAGETTINIVTDVTSFPSAGGLDISEYLSVVPQDPANDGSGDMVYVITDGTACTTAQVAKNSLNYNFWSDGDVYVIEANMESKDNCSVVAGDGHSDALYQIGTDPLLDKVNP
jgi:prepilin-type N-terminal cleavage/methylation domain-containing protein